MPRQTVIISAVVLAVGLFIFQVLLRYQYVHLVGTRFVRIDHLTGQTCVITDEPLLVSNPCDPPTEEQKQAFAISIARDTDNAIAAAATSGNYIWQAQDALTAAMDANPDNDKLTDPLVDGSVLDDAYLVCYCDTKLSGWRWEVHISTRQAFEVNGDAALSKRYGLPQ